MLGSGWLLGAGWRFLSGTKAGKSVVIAVLGALVLAGVYFWGGMSADRQNEIEDLRDDIEAHERINKAPTSGDFADDDARREWLRGLGGAGNGPR